MISFEEANRILGRLEQSKKEYDNTALERFDTVIHSLEEHREDFSKTCELALRKYRIEYKSDDIDRLCYGSIDSNPVFLTGLTFCGKDTAGMSLLYRTGNTMYPIALLPDGHIRVDGQWTTMEDVRKRLCGTGDLDSPVLMNTEVSFSFLLDWLELMVPDKLEHLKSLVLGYIESLEA